MADFGAATGKDEVGFKVKNAGKVGWNTDDIEVEITSNTAAEFELGSLATTGAEGTLTDALGKGGGYIIVAGGSIADLTLEFSDAKSQANADITIRLLSISNNKKLAKEAGSMEEGVAADQYFFPVCRIFQGFTLSNLKAEG